MLTLHAIFKGRVQGVGFRWTLVDHAEKHHLTGTARNLPNGTVEVYAQGPKEALEAFLKDVEGNSGLARIASINTRYKEDSHAFQGFRIIH